MTGEKMSEKTALSIEELKKEASCGEEALNRLYNIVSLLRKECPWDKEQTHSSLKTCMIEEAYEVCDAIDKKDKANLKEELGDVMLQVIFHSVLAEEKDNFTLTDVINAKSEKMIRRHPHIFAKDDVKTIDKVLEKWENIKRNEHDEHTYAEELKDVPSGMPALMRSYKVQKKAANAGFDWDNIDGALEKIKEETDEFMEAYKANDAVNAQKELGDLMFSIVNAARFMKIDPEQTLHESTEKFIRRFDSMEQKSTEIGKKLCDMSLKEMDEVWEMVKKSE